MRIRLLYGLKQGDDSYLDVFYPTRRLREAAAALGLDYAAKIYLPTDTVEEACSFCTDSIALIRGDVPLQLYRELEAAGACVVNPHDATALARDKLECAAFFARIGTRHPKTLCAEPSEAPPFPYPFIMKPRCGKMGRGVTLIKNEHEWNTFTAAHKLLYIAQEYIRQSRGRDIRFFFASFENAQTKNVVCVMRESESLASNAHRGGIMRAYSPPPQLAKEAAYIFEQSGLVYGSVDFLIEHEELAVFTVCEINSCPGFEALESAVQTDAAQAILRSVLRYGENHRNV